MVGAQIINTIRSEYPELFDDELIERISHEAEEAYKSEAKIIDWMVNGIHQDGLSADILKEFVKNRINESLEMISFKPVFEVDKELVANTMWFEEELLGNTSCDFFHSRPVEYSKKNHAFSEDDLF